MIKQSAKSFKPKLKQAIAPTILATAVFFLIYFLFGTENIMIGPIVTLSFLRFHTMHDRYECMIRNFAVFFIMVFLAYFAVMNLPLCIVINALALFWIAYIHIDEYHPDNYFPAGMALIFFQIQPAATPAALGNRLLALLAAFVVVFIFVLILSRIRGRKDPIPEYIRQGFDNVKRQLELCETYQTGSSGKSETMPDLSHREPDPDDCSPADDYSELLTHREPDPDGCSSADDYSELLTLRNELIEINKKCADEIYAHNRASIRPKGKTNWYCRFVLFFQVINYLTLYFKDEQNLADAKELYDDFLKQFETVQPAADYRRINVRLRKPDIRSFRLRFALRQVITLTPCLAFALVSGLPNIYWLVISVFFMMIPFTDHTLTRIRQRVLGTVGGIVLCLVLFSLFDSFAARVVIMIAANFFLYGASGYGITVIYLTCSALSLQTLNAVMPLMLWYRLLYTLIGAGIALLANRFIFPIRLQKQIGYVSEKVGEILKEMDEEPLPDGPADGRTEWENDQRIIQCFLLSKRVQSMCDMLPLDELNFDYHAFEKNYIFIMGRYLKRQFLMK